MSKSLVILSGGQDSATCLFIASQKYEEVHAITFDYDQRHSVEVESAKAIASVVGVTSHEVLTVGSILSSTSPLVSGCPVEKYDNHRDLPSGIEPSFIAGRNILFLTLAANRAALLGISDIFLGLCLADFEGYPDCRQTFVDAMATALSEGIYGHPDKFRILTPLMKLSKSDSVVLAMNLMGDRFDEIISKTHTCYDGVIGGCGRCHACILRDQGFREVGIPDPIWKFRC